MCLFKATIFVPFNQVKGLNAWTSTYSLGYTKSYVLQDNDLQSYSLGLHKFEENYNQTTLTNKIT